MLTLRAIQAVKGDAAATQEILRALKKAKGNMREACELLGIGKSSMYRLIKDLKCESAIEQVVGSVASGKTGGTKGKPVKAPPITVAPPQQPRMRVKKVA
jgi:hypothetical protein